MAILNIKPHPFKAHVDQVELTEECKVSDVVPDEAHFHVFKNGEKVGLDEFIYSDDVIDIVSVPQGNDQQTGGEKALSAGLQILTTALVTLATGGNFVAGLKAGSIIAGLTLISGAIAPNPTLGNSQANDFNRLGAFTGTKNELKPYGVIPKIYGKRKIFPPIAAKPFTEIIGNEQYLRVMYCIGQGLYELSNPKIGDTLIGSFANYVDGGPLDGSMLVNPAFTSNGNFDDIEIEVGDNPSLYTNDVDEIVPGTNFDTEDETATSTTSDNTDEINLTLTFAQGLYRSDDGKTKNAEAKFNVEFREVGEVDWESATHEDYFPQYINCEKQGSELRVYTNNSARETHRIGLRWKTLANGQYEVRVTREHTEESDEVNDAIWTSLQSVSYTDPVNTEGVKYLALRIKATDSVQGILDNFSLEAYSRTIYYSNSVPGWRTPDNIIFGETLPSSSNPAWICSDILLGKINAEAISTARIDESSFYEWASNCDTNGFTCDLVVDSSITVFELLKEVASYGRATIQQIDGIYIVIEDKELTVPVQHFTPRNSFNFRGSRLFPDVPHALKVRFANPDKDWEQDEAIVYDDNYSADGTGCLFGSGTCTTATRFETVTFAGITSWDLAWKTGRYMLAEMRLRPEKYLLDVDFEYLIANKGDLVKVTHDIPLWGLGTGRIKSVTRNGSNEVTKITLDDIVTMQSGTDYVIRIRLNDVSSELFTVTTTDGEFGYVDVTAKEAYINAGDIYMFGEVDNESVNLKIASIEAKDDLSATLTLVDDAPEIYEADTGTIPDFDSNITTPYDITKLIPPNPVIDYLRSDTETLYEESDRSKRLLISIGFTVAKGFPSLEVEARARVNGSSSSFNLYAKSDALTGNVTLNNVEQGQDYEVQIRAVNFTNVSDWVATTHTVVGKGDSPNDVTGFSAFVDKSQVRFKWNENSDPDISQYEIREGEDWSSGSFISRTKATSHTSEINSSGEKNYFIKAIDTAGNYSDGVDTDTITIDSKYEEDPIYSGDGYVIGEDIQAWDAGLDDISSLDDADGNFIVGSGTGWVAESGATARASLGANNASNLDAGTLPSGRVVGSYTGITGVGALVAGSISSTFGAIDIGSSALTAGSGAFSGSVVIADASGNQFEVDHLSDAGNSRAVFLARKEGTISWRLDHVYDTGELRIIAANNMNLQSGNFQIGGTTVIDSSRTGTFNVLDVATTSTFGGNATFENNIFVEGGLFAREFVVDSTRVQFDNLMTVGGGKVASVSGSAGSETITFEDENGNNIMPVAEDDILHIQVRSGTTFGTIVKNIYRVVDSISTNDVILTTTGITWTTGNDVGSIEVGDDIFTQGNITDADRDHYINFDISGVTVPRVSVFDNVDDVDNAGDLRMAWGGMNGIYGVTGDEVGLGVGDPTLVGNHLLLTNLQGKIKFDVFDFQATGLLISNESGNAFNDIADSSIFIDRIDQTGGAYYKTLGIKNDDSNYVRMYYDDVASEWGIEGAVGGNNIFQLGTTNKIASINFENGRLYTGSGSDFMGIQERSASDTKVFFSGATAKTGTGANFYVQADGKLFSSNIGRTIYNKSSVSATGVNSASADDVDDEYWNITSTVSGGGTDAFTPYLKIRFQKRFSENTITLNGYAKYQASGSTGDINNIDLRGRVRTISGTTYSSIVSNTDEAISDNASDQAISLDVDISGLTDGNYYLLEVGIYLNVTSGTGVNIDADVREDLDIFMNSI